MKARVTAITADKQKSSTMRRALMAGFITLSVLFAGAMVANKAQALEVPDFEQLVKDQGSAVVKISVTGSVLKPAPGYEDQELPEPLKRYFENLPKGQNPQGRQSTGFGSGFIISEDGYIVTNAHVIDNASQIAVALPDRREYIAELIGSDKNSDLALLKINGSNLPTVSLGNSDGVNVGQWVLAIGSPFGLEYTATQGIVSAVSRSLPNDNYVPFIQTDVAVNPGNSGGPLFNTEGKVVGVNSQIYSRSGGYQGISFAIPVNVVKTIVAQLKDTGYVSRGWLGVLIQGVDQTLAESFGLDRPTGALVSRVTDNSPAANAGVRSGDIILAFNGDPINRSSQLPPLVGLIPVGDTVDMQVLRKGERVNLLVSIAELDEGNNIAKPRKTKAKTTDRMDDRKLGVVVTELTREQRQQYGKVGVLVEKVDVNGVAASAGILEGDLLKSFNQTDITSVQQFAELIKSSPKGKPLPVLVERNSSPLYSALILNQ